MMGSYYPCNQNISVATAVNFGANALFGLARYLERVLVHL